MLMNGAGVCQALGCHYSSTLILPRYPHVLYILKVRSLQVTAISAFLGLPNPWAIGHGSWVHGKCFAAPGTTLGHVGLWGALSGLSLPAQGISGTLLLYWDPPGKGEYGSFCFRFSRLLCGLCQGPLPT